MEGNLADGHRVTQLHSDRRAEFRSNSLEKWCLSRTILQAITPGDQPQVNGRCEAIVQHINTAIRRTLHGAEAPFDRWPVAARFINERCDRSRSTRRKRHRLSCRKFWSEKDFGRRASWSPHRRPSPSCVLPGSTMDTGLKEQMELRH